MKVSPLQSIFWLLNNWKDIDEKWWTFDLFFCNSIWFLINMRSNFTDNPQSLVSFLSFFSFSLFFTSFCVVVFFIRIFAVKRKPKWWTFDLFFWNSIWFLINMRSNFTDNPQSLVSFLFFQFFFKCCSLFFCVFFFSSFCEVGFFFSNFRR